MIREPMVCPLREINWPSALSGMSRASAVTSKGYPPPSRTVVTSVISTAVRMFFFMMIPSSQAHCPDDYVNKLDADERDNHSSHAVQQQVPAQQCLGAHGSVLHSAQGKRNECNDDQRVENYCREHGRLRRRQTHDVQRVQHRESSGKHRRDDGKVFGHVVG